MAVSPPGFSLVYYVLLCMLVRDSLSVPTTAVRQARGLTAKPLSLPLISSLGLIPTRNITSSREDFDIVYRVPNTYVILE